MTIETLKEYLKVKQKYYYKLRAKSADGGVLINCTKQIDNVKEILKIIEDEEEIKRQIKIFKRELEDL